MSFSTEVSSGSYYDPNEDLSIDNTYKRELKGYNNKLDKKKRHVLDNSTKREKITKRRKLSKTKAKTKAKLSKIEISEVETETETETEISAVETETETETEISAVRVKSEKTEIEISEVKSEKIKIEKRFKDLKGSLIKDMNSGIYTLRQYNMSNYYSYYTKLLTDKYPSIKQFIMSGKWIGEDSYLPSYYGNSMMGTFFSILTSWNYPIRVDLYHVVHVYGKGKITKINERIVEDTINFLKGKKFTF
jgi:hypothetical protein